MTLKFIYAVLLSCAFVFSQSAMITGRVVGAADGDTVAVLNGANTHHKIRYS